VIKLATEITGKNNGQSPAAGREVQNETAVQTQGRVTSVRNSVFWVVIAIVFLGILIANSPLLRLKSVFVKGNQAVAAETIVLATRITRNQSILRLNRRRAQQAILRNPYIAKVQLDVVWPHWVVIRVTERRPVCWAAWSGACYLVGNDGAVLGAATKERRAKFPEVSGVRFRDLQVGTPICVPDMVAALTILNKCDRKLRPFLAKLDMTHRQLFFNYSDHFRPLVVELGDTDHLAEKMANLRAILAENHDQVPLRIDLRVPEIATVTARTLK
jgi:cell division protein FtsQ